MEIFAAPLIRLCKECILNSTFDKRLFFCFIFYSEAIKIMQFSLSLLIIDFLSAPYHFFRFCIDCLGIYNVKIIVWREVKRVSCKHLYQTPYFTFHQKWKCCPRCFKQKKKSNFTLIEKIPYPIVTQILKNAISLRCEIKFDKCCISL